MNRLGTSLIHSYSQLKHGKWQNRKVLRGCPPHGCSQDSDYQSFYQILSACCIVAGGARIWSQYHMGWPTFRNKACEQHFHHQPTVAEGGKRRPKCNEQSSPRGSGVYCRAGPGREGKDHAQIAILRRFKEECKAKDFRSL